MENERIQQQRSQELLISLKQMQAKLNALQKQNSLEMSQIQ